MTDLSEAHRQYQIALEHDRRVCTETDGYFSMQDERDSARLELTEAWEEMFRVWQQQRER